MSTVRTARTRLSSVANRARNSAAAPRIAAGRSPRGHVPFASSNSVTGFSPSFSGFWTTAIASPSLASRAAPTVPLPPLCWNGNEEWQGTPCSGWRALTRGSGGLRRGGARDAALVTARGDQRRELRAGQEGADRETCRYEAARGDVARVRQAGIARGGRHGSRLRGGRGLVTCLERMPKCVGRIHRFSPKVRGRLVLAGAGGARSGIPVSGWKQLRCSQRLPNRNHHCVLVVEGSRELGAGECSQPCHLSLLLGAHHRRARRG